MRLVNRYIEDSKEEETLTKRWVEIAGPDESDNLYQYFKYTELETGDETLDPVVGLRLDYKDYMDMIGTIGNKQLFIQFGLTETNFCCVLFTKSDTKRLDESFLVTTPVFLSEIEKKQGEMQSDSNSLDLSIAATGSIPKQVVTQWVKNWVNELKDKTVMDSLFRTPESDNKEVLKGFAFDIGESINVLFNQIPDSSKDVSEVVILFTNHHSGRRDNTAMNTFGLVLIACAKNNETHSSGKEEENQHLEIVGAFFDLGTPCPPTCP